MEDSIVIPIKVDASGMEDGAKKAESAMRDISKHAKETRESVGGASGSAADGGGIFEGFGKKAKMAAANMRAIIPRSFQKQLNSISSGIRKMGSSLKGIGNSAKSLGAQIIGAASVYGIMSKAISTYMSQNQQLSKQVGAIWTALGNLIGPIIEAIVAWITKLISMILSFLKLIGVTTKTASELSKKANSAGGSLQKTIAGFDELNKLQSGGGGGGAGTLSDYDPSKIMQDLAEAIASGDFYRAGELVGQKFGEIMGKVDQFFIDLDSKDYGSKFADFVNGLFSDQTPFVTAGTAVGDGLNVVIHAFDHFVNGTNWGQIGSTLASSINALFGTVDWESIGMGVSGALNGIMDLLYNFAKDIDVLGIARDVTTALNKAIDNINWAQIGALVQLLVLDSIEGLVEFVRTLNWMKLIRGLFDIIVGTIQEIMSDPTRMTMICVRFIYSIGNVVMGIIMGLVTGILDLLGTFIPGLSDIGDKMEAAWDGMMDQQTKDLDQMEASLREMLGSVGEAADETNGKVSGLTGTIHDQATAANELGGNVSNTNSIFGEYRQELEAIAHSTDSATDSMYQLEGGATAMNSAIQSADAEGAARRFEIMGNAAVDAGEEGSSAFKLYSDPLEAAGLSADATAESIEATSKATDALGESLTNVKDIAVSFAEEGTTKMNSFSEAIVAVAESSGTLTKAISKISEAGWNMVSAMQNVRNALENVFDMQWKLPNLILPHLQVYWESQDWMQTFFGVSALPHLYVQWYKKGGIVDGAQLIGAGEDGKEAIIPLERNTEWIDMVAKGLLDRLQNMKISSPVSLLNDIASTTQFKMPVVASGVVAPYSVSTAVGYNSSAVGGTASSDVFADLYNAIRSLDDSLNNMQWIAQFDDVRAIVRRITKEQRRNTISEGR